MGGSGGESGEPGLHQGGWQRQGESRGLCSLGAICKLQISVLKTESFLSDFCIVNFWGICTKGQDASEPLFPSVGVPDRRVVQLYVRQVISYPGGWGLTQDPICPQMPSPPLPPSEPGAPGDDFTQRLRKQPAVRCHWHPDFPRWFPWGLKYCH